MDPIDGRDRALFQFAGNSLVCNQHEFFDQLVRFVVLDTFQFYRMPFFIDPDFYLWKIEVQCAMLEPLLSHQCCQFPGNVQPFPQLIAGRRAQDCISLFVRKPMRASNDAVCKPCAFCGAVLIEMDKY